MLVLLDCRPLQNAGPDNEKSRFILTCAALLSIEQEVKWLFLVDHRYHPGTLPFPLSAQYPGPGLPLPVNSPPLPVGQPPLSGALASGKAPTGALLIRRALPGRAGWKVWYEGQIPRLAKKYKADLIMTTAGIAAAAVRIPQCVWMPPRPNPNPSTLQRAAAIFCFSEKDKSSLSAAPEKIVVVSGAPDPFVTPLSPAEKSQARISWAEGKEYFLANITSAPLPDVVNLLKAFSLFKKRQHSNMHLVLLGAPVEKQGQLSNRLSSYKYRQEVQWLEQPSDNDRVQLSGASYATLFLSGDDAPGLSLLNALKAGVPVMTPPGSFLAEIAGDATLPAAPDDPTALAGQLMRIYKDESFRGSLIAKGQDRLLASGSCRPIDTIWQGIRLALGS